MFPRLDTSQRVLSSRSEESYWLLLHRKSNIEFLYKGKPGSVLESQPVKTFRVKTGIPNEKPTPLPKLLGREYWMIVKKESSLDNPETAPYFLTLDIPVSEEEPFGPSPYLECSDSLTGERIQCNWLLSGYFGLHGVNGDASKLSDEDLGSSGCIRHKDEDITYLYDLLEPQNQEIRYYIQDI